MFALRHVDSFAKLVGFRVESNHDADFCTGVEFILDVDAGNVWVTTSYAVAERAAATSSEWYNATFDNPNNPYVGKLQVVELVSTF